MTRFLSVILGVVFLTTVMACCTAQPPVMQANETVLQYDRSHLKRAFVFLRLDIELQACAYKEGELIQCQEGHAAKTASGFVIDKTDAHMSIITAAHFCKDHAGKVEREQTAGELQVRSTGESKLTIKDYAANTFTNDKITIIAQDPMTDIDTCLIQVDDPSLSDLDIMPVTLADMPPLWGDYIFHVGAPRGIYVQGSPLIFQGIFVGKPDDRDVYVVTSYTLPGSSGGMIVDATGRVVGMIHEYIPTIAPHGGRGATLPNLRRFICSNIDDARKHQFTCSN